VDRHVCILPLKLDCRDSLGSDVFSRVVYRSRISIESALISVGLALLVGLPVGLVSGYFRCFWDEWVVMRVVDSIQAFPFLIRATASLSPSGEQ
jgi:peptide/nickel transport system permease protein